MTHKKQDAMLTFLPGQVAQPHEGPHAQLSPHEQPLSQAVHAFLEVPQFLQPANLLAQWSYEVEWNRPGQKSTHCGPC